MELYNFTEWNKLDIDNFLLSEKIQINEKISIFDSYLKWLRENINSLSNLNIYPIFNLILTYVYIKENLSKSIDYSQVNYYLNYNLNIKSSIEDLSDKKIIGGTVALLSLWNILHSKLPI
jgi:hypothetical protein